MIPLVLSVVCLIVAGLIVWRFWIAPESASMTLPKTILLGVLTSILAHILFGILFFVFLGLITERGHAQHLNGSVLFVISSGVIITSFIVFGWLSVAIGILWTLCLVYWQPLGVTPRLKRGWHWLSSLFYRVLRIRTALPRAHTWLLFFIALLLFPLLCLGPFSYYILLPQTPQIPQTSWIAWGLTFIILTYFVVTRSPGVWQKLFFGAVSCLSAGVTILFLLVLLSPLSLN